MLSPKKLKFRKQQKGRIRGEVMGNTLSFGDLDLWLLSQAVLHLVKSKLQGLR